MFARRELKGKLQGTKKWMKKERQRWDEEQEREIRKDCGL
jgi:hypothetical protein